MKYHRILMIGTALDSHGGMSRLQGNILANWPESKYILEHLVTHRDVSSIRKFVIFIQAVLKFITKILFVRPDLIHIHFSVNASIYRKSVFILLSKFFGAKVVLHAHTGVLVEYISSLNFLARSFLAFSLKQADAFVALATQDIPKYQQYSKNKPVFLRNPIEVGPAQSDLSQRIVVTAGRLSEAKGSIDLLKAIPQIYTATPDAHFIFAGNGDLESLRKMSCDLQVDQLITFTGWLGHDQLMEVYKSAGIFVLPSYHEGMPLAILEAMSFGLPVVSTGVNGIPDVVLDGETGILVQPGDVDALTSAIIKLLVEPELRKRMGQKGKQRVETLFSFSAVTQNWIALYDSILGAQA
jgi:glycosyltransferase involved in cell wall biosynthesis